MNHAPSPQTVARLKRRLKKLGITHDQVAAEASVHRTTVVKVLGGQGKSRRLIKIARRLIVEAGQRKNGTS